MSTFVLWAGWTKKFIEWYQTKYLENYDKISDIGGGVTLGEMNIIGFFQKMSKN